MANTALQEHLIQLMAEIDAACKENNLRYALFGDTAFWAKARGAFVGGQCELHMMMRACDMLALKKALLAKGAANRAVEDLFTNPLLAWNTLRYVDTGTTLIFREEATRFQELGVAVIVHPLYAKPFGNTTMVAEIGTSYLHGGKGFNGGYLGQPRKMAFEKMVGLEKRFGPKLVTWPLRRHLKQDKGAAGDTLYYLHATSNVRQMPSKLLAQTQLVPFEGLQLPVPADMEAYAKNFYKAAWVEANAEKPKTANTIWAIQYADIPYKQALETMKAAGVDMRKLQQQVYDYHMWFSMEFRYWKRITTDEYAAAKLSRDRIDLFCELEPEMPKLREAYAAKDKAVLAPYFEKYTERTEHYKKKGLGFFVTPELFDMAKMVWGNSKKKKEFAKEIYSLVPKEYKEQDLGAFLALYR